MNNNPNLPIIDILTASLSAPFVFTLDKQTYLVDGGVTDNYPIWIYLKLFYKKLILLILII